MVGFPTFLHRRNKIEYLKKKEVEQYAKLLVEDRNCINKPIAVKEAMGCCVSCGCEKKENNLFWIDYYYNLKILYQENRLSLHDIDSESFNIITDLIWHEQYHKSVKDKLAEDQARALGFGNDLQYKPKKGRYI